MPPENTESVIYTAQKRFFPHWFPGLKDCCFTWMLQVLRDLLAEDPMAEIGDTKRLQAGRNSKQEHKGIYSCTPSQCDSLVIHYFQAFSSYSVVLILLTVAQVHLSEWLLPNLI